MRIGGRLLAAVRRFPPMPESRAIAAYYPYLFLR